MALVVETGAIVPGANSYAGIPTADEYHADRGNADWASAAEADKTTALIRATAYIDGKYRRRWKGARVNPVTQPLEWPRLSVDMESALTGSAFRGSNYYSNYLSNAVPPEVVQATCEAALRALSFPLAADIHPKDRVSRKKVDVIEYEYTAKDFTTCYQVIDQLVSRFLKSPAEAVRG